MSEPQDRPVLRPGCRLSPAGDALFIPEGVLRLQGPASRILEACDGLKTVPEIVSELLKDFPGADRTKITEETNAFLMKLRDRAVLEFV